MKKSHFLGEKGWDWDTPLPPHLDIVPSLSQVWPIWTYTILNGVQTISNQLFNMSRTDKKYGLLCTKDP